MTNGVITGSKNSTVSIRQMTKLLIQDLQVCQYINNCTECVASDFCTDKSVVGMAYSEVQRLSLSRGVFCRSIIMGYL